MSREPQPPGARDEALVEAIAARDANNLYRASCFFQDRERYRSFCAQYAVMRVVDDRIDSLPSRQNLSAGDLEQERRVVHAWRKLVDGIYAGRSLDEQTISEADRPDVRSFVAALRPALHRFPVPAELWQSFYAAMLFDLERPRFRTFVEFLGYAEGATVAPTTIFLYLLAASPDGTGRYVPPRDFDLLAAGRALGLFAYLGHIVRDLADDLSTGNEGLLYVAQDDLARHGLTEEVLFRDLSARQASASVRSLVASLIERARAYLAEGRTLLSPLSGAISPDCAFILELTIALYEETVDKIELCECDSFQGLHQLTDAEKRGIATVIGQRTGFQPTAPSP